MVQGDLQARVQNTVQQFQAQGISLDQWLQATGQDPAAFIEALRVQSRARPSRSTWRCAPSPPPRSIEVGDDDLDAEYAAHRRAGAAEAGQVRKAYEQNDAVTDLHRPAAQDARRSTGCSTTSRSSTPTAPRSTATLLLGHDHDHDHDHDGHDHDHDHDGHDHDHDHDHDHAGHDHEH